MKRTIVTTCALGVLLAGAFMVPTAPALEQGVAHWGSTWNANNTADRDHCEGFDEILDESDCDFSQIQAPFSNNGSDCPSYARPSAPNFPLGSDLYVWQTVSIPLGATQLRVQARLDNAAWLYVNGELMDPTNADNTTFYSHGVCNLGHDRIFDLPSGATGLVKVAFKVRDYHTYGLSYFDANVSALAP